MTTHAPHDALLLAPAAPFRPEAVIFDMDGTLLDTEALHHRAQRETAQALGQTLPEEIHRQFVGVHREMNDHHLRRIWGADFDVDGFNAEADALFDRLWRASMPLRAGARELLEALAQTELALGLCTSTRSPNAQEKLEAAGFSGFFQSVVTLNDVDDPKPHPQPYLHSARNLGVDPSRCVVIEDSPNGLRSGAAAGMTVLLVPDLIAPTPETRALAHAVLPDLFAVRDWIAAALV